MRREAAAHAAAAPEDGGLSSESAATNGNPQDFIFDAFKWNMQKYRRGWFDANFVPALLVECGIAQKTPDGKVVALTADARRMLSLYSVRHRFHRILDNSNVSLKRQLVLTGHADLPITSNTTTAQTFWRCTVTYVRSTRWLTCC